MTYARRNEISPRIVESLLRTEQLGDVEGPQPADRRTARLWLGEMIEMALVDGEISADERHVLVKVGHGVGLGDYDINLEIALRRAQARREKRQYARIAGVHNENSGEVEGEGNPTA